MGSSSINRSSNTNNVRVGIVIIGSNKIGYTKKKDNGNIVVYKQELINKEKIVNISNNKILYINSEGEPLIGQTKINQSGDTVLYNIKPIDSIVTIKHKNMFGFTFFKRPNQPVVHHMESEEEANKEQSVFQYFHGWKKICLSNSLSNTDKDTNFVSCSPS